MSRTRSSPTFAGASRAPASRTPSRAPIGPLAEPAAHGGDPRDAFHVVAPSLPGFGFSDHPRQPGTNHVRIAELWVDLMGQLGYPRFGAQGGDSGAMVGMALGGYHPERLV